MDKLINLHEGYRRQFKFDNLSLLLLQEQGELYLCEARCPHQEHPLDSAPVSDGMLECPCTTTVLRWTTAVCYRPRKNPVARCACSHWSTKATRWG
ncbi:Rieske 2Fe-2S domain-containing protein [Kineobactrum salinum]|uniref:Rieske 2Fe-2S domain-containing protein n=1 Tax=Kineobactrum salinum TaxID=2708301 RepID=A0A6C0TZF0_9GAMM|nr:Rieske 2Fe-2S domain-containing protein [Kineobactrum salinum]